MCESTLIFLVDYMSLVLLFSLCFFVIFGSFVVGGFLGGLCIFFVQLMLLCVFSS